MAKLRVDKIAAPIVKDEFTGSVFFDGSSDYLSLPVSSDFQFGSGDFTIECWAYALDEGTDDILGIYNTGSNRRTFALRKDQTEAAQFLFSTDGSSGTSIASSASVIQLRTWHHYAVVRRNLVYELYFDGVKVATKSDSTGAIYTNNDDGLRIGSSYNTDFHGYISNVRICKGHAVYDGNFTVPTRELEVHLGAKGVVFPAADNRTILLACQSSTDATAEATGRHTLTANGNATAVDANPGLFRRTNISSTTTENTGSVFFDGSSDWLRARGGDNFSDFDFGSSDFTIEGFFYANDVNGTDIPIALAADTVSANSDAGWYIRYQSNKIEGQSFSGSDNIGITTSGTVSNDTWYHVAYVREGSTFTLYVDGTAVDTATSSSSLNWNSGWKVEIGSGYGGANYFAGYISNLRICKGHAVYTSNFAPPTRELEVHQGPDDDRTVLLACYDGENIFAEKTGRHILASQGNRTSSPTLASGETPVGITTHNPGLTRNVDPTAGPTFQGGAGFTSQNWLTLPKGTTTDRNRTGGRAVYAGGYGDPAYSNTIEYVNITSAGNGKEFGDLTTHALSMAPTSSSTRGVWIGKETSSSPNVASTIDYVTIASEGNAVDFGDYIGSTIRTGGGVSSSTRGIIGGGATPTITDVIQFITFATLGNGSNFGTLTDARRDVAGAQSTTRGLFAGGLTPGISDIIDFVTMATAGNATDFGDLTAARTSLGALSSHTRAVFGAGGSPNSGSPQNNLDQVTIATLGNATDFGDLYVNRSSGTGTSNKVRGIFVGGLISPSPVVSSNTIDYVTIASTGNAADFGDAIKTDRSKAAVSDSHGGL